MFVKKTNMIIMFYFMTIKMPSIRADLRGTKRRISHKPPLAPSVRILDAIVTGATPDEREAGGLYGDGDLPIRTQCPVGTAAYLLCGRRRGGNKKRGQQFVRFLPAVSL